MRWVLWRSSLRYGLVFGAGMATAIAATPLWKLALIKSTQATYGELTYLCDRAMRGHMIAKMTVSNAPSTESVGQLKAAEIELLACQDYDLMRKRLIRWGLTENELSEMALEVIEARATTLHDVIRVHEIRY